MENDNKIVRLVGADIVADTRDLAQVMEIEHESVVRLINQQIAAFEEFGVLRFEIGKPSSPLGGRPQSFAILNENQCYLLLTFVRNSKVTVSLKTKLIAAFSRAREELARVRMQDQNVGLFLQDVPHDWQRRFPESFFEAVMECYGISYIKEQGTPSFVGHFINRYIYEPLLGNLSDELKAKRAEHSKAIGRSESSFKLHQFLKENCAEALERHVLSIETILRISNSDEDFKEYFARRYEGRSQLALEFRTQAERRRNRRQAEKERRAQ